jgi:hypothetical protein
VIIVTTEMLRFSEYIVRHVMIEIMSSVKKVEAFTHVEAEKASAHNISSNKG